jgi:hypothetical protein
MALFVLFEISSSLEVEGNALGFFTTATITIERN